jgi:hypothetical protein
MELMNAVHRKLNMPKQRAQAITEFALVLPILMVLLVGILEVGRLVLIYAGVTNASREATRYASAVGFDEDGLYHYNNCNGIRRVAKRAAYFMNLQDDEIVITYDSGPSTTIRNPVCDGTDTVVSGDRVIVTINTSYSPLVKLIPIGTKDINSSSARTILGFVDVGSSSGGSGCGVGCAGGSPATSAPTGPTNAPTDTPPPTNTPTATPTFTPRPTSSGPGITLTIPSLPTNSPTNTPINNPTNTPTATPTYTLTATPTAFPGCNSITHGQITTSGNTMSMAVTNPHDSVTVSNVLVIWNLLGGPNGSALTLEYATLGGVFWTGSNSTGRLTITPSITITIPGNNTTSTISFIFNKAYKTVGLQATSITITLSTPGCEIYPIQQVLLSIAN